MAVTVAGKTYRGHRDGRGNCLIEVVRAGQEVGHPLKHEVHHSPTGFEWGYGGSGPADLARSLLADHLGFLTPPLVYQHFKAAVVAQLDRDRDWAITSDHVALILSSIKTELGIDCLACCDRGMRTMPTTWPKFEEAVCECRAGLQLMAGD